jgi:hypothetical protein
MKQQLPNWPLRFLRWYCREDFLEEIEGDLAEIYFRQYEQSPVKAGRQFTRNLIKHFRPDFIRSIRPELHYNTIAMIKNYFNSAWRNLIKHKFFSFISVTGLAIGLAWYVMHITSLYNLKTRIMFSSIFSLLRGAIMSMLLLSSSCFLWAQNTRFENFELEPLSVNMSIANIDGKKAVRIARDTATKGADLPTFVRMKNTDNFSNGTIELMLLSRLLPTADASARGFIGIAFRINKENTRFESIYIRPTNGRADDQLRRNHSTQYFSHPDYPFDRLRKEAEGKYESYADMGLNEWIKMKIVVKDAQARLYLNDNPQPVLIVNDLKLGAANSGAIGLWVDGGTDAFFRDIKVVKEN